MKFTFLLELDSSTMFIIYALAIILTWVIFYYTIKGAVKNVIIEARSSGELSSIENTSTIIERPFTSKHKTLQERYDSGEISFEEYKSEWDKL